MNGIPDWAEGTVLIDIEKFPWILGNGVNQGCSRFGIGWETVSLGLIANAAGPQEILPGHGLVGKHRFGAEVFHL
ncbi:MAG: hypothetical protein HQM02_09460 [Magnetococcales bacterium]|nr:hypothetical protein [Magnetococcales bacterium]